MCFTKKDALQVIDRKKELFFSASDAIWEHPETAFQEYQSVELLCKLLEQEGFQVQRNIAGIATAFMGVYGHGRPIIGILGEFDALSGMSQKAGLPYKEALCNGEAGHGCGHHLISPGAIAAAVAIREYLKNNQREGTVIFYGCPGEEGGSGKAFMARDGVFDTLDCALSWHPSDKNLVWTGRSLANNQVYYRFHGISAHAAVCPELGRSALDAVELMNTGVQYLREHIIQEARIHYAVTNAGGYSPNVIPSYAESLYLIRAPKNEQVKEILARVNDIAAGAALMTGTTVETQFVKACSNLVDNTTLQEVMQKNLEEIRREPYTKEEMEFAKKIAATYGGQTFDEETIYARYEKINWEKAKKIYGEYSAAVINDFIVPLADKEILLEGSTDVGDVSWICPTAQIYTTSLAAGTPEHSWQLVAQGKSSLSHKGLLFAAKVIAASFIDLLEHPDIIVSAREELIHRLNGKNFQSPIPKGVSPYAIGKK